MLSRGGIIIRSSSTPELLRSGHISSTHTILLFMENYRPYIGIVQIVYHQSFSIWYKRFIIYKSYHFTTIWYNIIYHLIRTRDPIDTWLYSSTSTSPPTITITITIIIIIVVLEWNRYIDYLAYTYMYKYHEFCIGWGFGVGYWHLLTCSLCIQLNWLLPYDVMHGKGKWCGGLRCVISC